jgi:hypothetical protein
MKREVSLKRCIFDMANIRKRSQGLKRTNLAFRPFGLLKHLTPDHLTPDHLTPDHLTPDHLTPDLTHASQVHYASLLCIGEVLETPQQYRPLLIPHGQVLSA